MFYNENQKIRYINQSSMPETSIEVFRRIVAGATKVEIQEKTDLSNFNRQQVINLLKSYNSRSKWYLRLICHHFSEYYSWCLQEKLVDTSNITNWYHVTLSKPIIDEILPIDLLEEKFFDKDLLIEMVNRVKDPTNKLYLYAPFFGIDGEEHSDLRYLKIEDLNEKRKMIYLNSDKYVKVDDLFIELIKNADNADRYDEDGMGTIKKSFRNTYGESQYVFKVCNVIEKDVIVNTKTINNRYAIIKEQTGNNMLTSSVVYKNGLINYIKEYYEKEHGINIKEALFKLGVGRKNSYLYDSETQKLIEEFGSRLTVRMLRLQMTESIDYYI